MTVTKVDNQELSLENKIETFFVRSMQNRKKNSFCITKDVMAVLMDKWSLLVIYNLAYYKTLRFGKLKSNISGISGRMLSVTLKKLESHNITIRKVFAEVPPRVEYDLTAFGKELAAKSVDFNEWLLDKYTSTETELVSPITHNKSTNS